MKYDRPNPVNHCMLVTCDKCKKTTWKGCGKHVEQVMKDVKEEDKCACPRGEAATTTATTSS